VNQQNDRRDFDRFPIEFTVEVVTQDSDGKKHKEQTVLMDISGGGARFITREAEQYFPGQLLEITIYLPGAEGVKAHMRGRATVVRVDTSSGLPGVAIKLDTSLRFERLEVKT
jgi:hypothetical protein